MNHKDKAPRLSRTQINQIIGMFEAHAPFPAIAAAVGWGEDSIRMKISYLRRSGAVDAPPRKPGVKPTVASA